MFLIKLSPSFLNRFLPSGLRSRHPSVETPHVWGMVEESTVGHGSDPGQSRRKKNDGKTLEEETRSGVEG